MVVEARGRTVRDSPFVEIRGVSARPRYSAIHAFGRRFPFDFHKEGSYARPTTRPRVVP